jgi:hypothetical protein
MAIDLLQQTLQHGPEAKIDYMKIDVSNISFSSIKKTGLP